MEAFVKIAPHLANPLVLVGFVLFLVFGVHKTLVKSNILKPVSAKDSGLIVKLVLTYGFLISILIILLGFGYAAWQSHVEQNAKVELGRIKAESIIQKNRGNIERCVSKMEDIVFLNFFFSYMEGGGVGVDVLYGNKILSAPNWHTRLPGGIYNWKEFTTLLEKQGVEYSNPPKDVDVGKRLYFIHGNTEEENYYDFHAVVHAAEIGEKLSVTFPDANGCVLDAIKAELSIYNALPGDKPFLHRYITDSGIKLSTPRKRE